MAIVATYKFTEGLAAGGTVIVRDDCYAGISAEELARRRAEVARAIDAINRDLWEKGIIIPQEQLDAWEEEARRGREELRRALVPNEE